MTPLGAKMRAIRTERGIPLKVMANAIGVSPAYLSALEHGQRGQPTFYLLQKIIVFFNVIWDEAEELERLSALSDPRVVVNTAGMAPAATELANLLAQSIGVLDENDLAALLDQLKTRIREKKRRAHP